MDPWEWVQRVIQSEATKPQVVRINPAHVQRKRVRAQALEANQGYFRLVVSDIWLTHDFQWGKSIHAGIQSLVRIKAAGSETTIPGVAGPDSFEIDTRDRRGVATRNQFMTQPIPFRGGTIAIQVALLRIPGQDYLKSFVNVLSSFSDLVAVPPLTTAMQVADKVNDGLGTLLGLGQVQLHAGLQDTFTGRGMANELVPGFIAVIRTAGEKIDPQNLWIGPDGDLREGPLGRNPYTRFDYMVLQLDVSVRRDDWTEFPAIGEPYRKARERASLGDLKGAQKLIESAISAVMLSADIVDRQKDSIVVTLREVVRPTRPPKAGPTAMLLAPSPLRRVAVDRRALPTARDVVRLEARRFNVSDTHPV